MRALMMGLLIPAAAAATAAVPVAPAQEVPIQALFGAFEGRTLFPMGEPRNRELSVRIERSGSFGFTVAWRTTIHKSRSRMVEREQVIEFEPTRRADVYTAVSLSESLQSQAQAAPSPHGGGVGGPPYAWARLAGRTLTVNVLTIEAGGDYIVQTYDRTLTDRGMQLEFKRVRNGHIERQIKGNLNRVGG